MSTPHDRLNRHRVTIHNCCSESSSLGLLLGTAAPVMTLGGADFSFFVLFVQGKQMQPGRQMPEVEEQVCMCK